MESINHHPKDFGKWIDYSSTRFKTPYDLKLKTGEEFYNYYPNGTGWHGSIGRIDDSEVNMIRLPDRSIGSHSEYELSNEERITDVLENYIL